MILWAFFVGMCFGIAVFVFTHGERRRMSELIALLIEYAKKKSGQ